MRCGGADLGLSGSEAQQRAATIETASGSRGRLRCEGECLCQSRVNRVICRRCPAQVSLVSGLAQCDVFELAALEGARKVTTWLTDSGPYADNNRNTSNRALHVVAGDRKGRWWSTMRLLGSGPAAAATMRDAICDGSVYVRGESSGERSERGRGK
jgi:hypothetical protein